MRKISILSILLSLISASCLAQVDLTVVVEGLKNNHGTVMVGLFYSSQGFPENPPVGKVTRISGNSATVVFANLQPGRYALAVIHDENGNGKLDKNVVGLPVEGFGFGNDAMGLFGPPSFAKASVAIEKRSVRQRLKMRYF